MYNDLKGKNVIITGGSRGIGSAIAHRFKDEGARVISISRHTPEDTDDRITYYNCDVSGSNNVKSTIENILSKFNGIDILVNNAGIEEYARLDKTDEGMWDRIMDINVKGVYNVSKYCIPEMIKNHSGNIINISSVQANIITKNAAAYVTSKHAIIGLTKSIALDYAPEIRCNAVLPATIDTPLVRKAAILEVGNNEEKIKDKIREWGLQHPLGRIGKPEEVANVVIFLASSQSSFITGSSIMVDGGLSIKAPISTPDE
ncbi:glucose 1-dehydrogenase [Ferroplasma acidiphilum]|uniref:Glucose 1-dehydrogenase n=1 Tax=Ferroplasma acidiphilum TaxID=74969 RepID=A0A7K4FN88_9ARCH|nr:glucose 1-dehydrogenase [Ferroplasma acidiphilum]NOL59759.1 glucose 1-dehydrogenase [Ferroplasma acidiphilum]